MVIPICDKLHVEYSLIRVKLMELSMDVILLEKIGGLGELGDNVTVRPGYGRNYLLPKGKAVIANAENLKKVEDKRIELEKEQNESLEAAKVRADAVQKLDLVILARVSEENKLYGSVGTQDISEAILKGGVSVEKKEIILPNGPIRESGSHEVDIRLHADVKFKVALTISQEESAET